METEADVEATAPLIAEWYWTAEAAGLALAFFLAMERAACDLRADIFFNINILVLMQNRSFYETALCAIMLFPPSSTFQS